MMVVGSRGTVTRTHTFYSVVTTQAASTVTFNVAVRIF
jgi:hypothetical protein